MNEQTFVLSGATLTARNSGALFWADEALLCVSDLHIGKAERIARGGGTLLPPYETEDTLSRLQQDIFETGAQTVICLGDSFDDLAASAGLSEDHRLWLTRMQAGRRWVWVEGNHDPGPVDLGGEQMSEFRAGSLTFRHIAERGANGEISGHYHPKARLLARGRMISRPCFLTDKSRAILPAYGTYTGGLCWTDRAFDNLFGASARAFLIGKTVTQVPMPQRAGAE